MGFFAFINHPAVIAVVAIVAVGVLVYEIVSSQNTEEPYGNGRRGRDQGTRSEEQEIVSYEDTVNNVRQRKRSETAVKSRSTNTNSRDERILPKTPTKKFDQKDYCQNVFDKIENDVKNLNKGDDDKKTFHKNIDDCHKNSSSGDIGEIKVINIQASNVNQESEQQHSRNALPIRDNSCNQETTPTNRNDPCCSSVRNVSNDKKNLSETVNSLCMACEEVLANAVAYPCKHCYMCINCANIIHRIYKKCNECNSEIYHFQTMKM